MKRIIKNSIALWCFLILGTCQALAQEISGKVLYEDGSPVDMATVIVLNAQDSTLVKGEITNIDGNFGISIDQPGTYVIKVSFIGFKDFTSQAIPISNSNMTLPNITLEESNFELEGVTVATRRPMIVVKADRTIFNTEGNIASAGTNGLELLRKAPGVMLGNDDNIALRGRNGVLVYLDGKRSFLEPQELANLLRSLNATDIESIEIITNPSARYDASGNAGIINIVTKKGKALGTNGTITATSGYDEEFKNSLSLNLNHRMENFNIYGGVSLARNKFVSSLRARKTQDSRYFDQTIQNYSEESPVNGKLGVDYTVNSKHSFGVLFNVNSNLGERLNTSSSRTDISDGEGMAVDSLLLANSDMESNFVNASANANYRYADTLGNELTVDVNRSWFRSNSVNDQPNTYTNADGTVILNERNFLTDSNTDIDIYTAQADYEHRFEESGLSLSAGAKYAKVVSDNDFGFFNEINNIFVLDETQSNQFEYTENVTAAYANAMLPLSKKITFQAGLRWENTHSVGNLQRLPSQVAQPQDHVERKYNNLFPSAAMTYEINESNGLVLSYSRRIDRPMYATLNPFEVRIDDISYRKGNPFLNPQFSNNYELKYILNGTSTFGFSYSKSTDNIVNIIELDQNQPDIIFVNYRNLADRSYYALDFSTPTRFANWWNGFVNLTLYRSRYQANFPEFSYDITTPVSANLFAQQTFTLGNGWTFETSGWFNSRTFSENGFETKGMGSWDVGLQKKVFNDNGTFKLSYSDILRTANWEGINGAVENLHVNTTTVRETQILQLSFNYRFGKSTVKNPTKRSTGSEEEQNRIN